MRHGHSGKRARDLSHESEADGVKRQRQDRKWEKIRAELAANLPNGEPMIHRVLQNISKAASNLQRMVPNQSMLKTLLAENRINLTGIAGDIDYINAMSNLLRVYYYIPNSRNFNEALPFRLDDLNNEWLIERLQEIYVLLVETQGILFQDFNYMVSRVPGFIVSKAIVVKLIDGIGQLKVISERIKTQQIMWEEMREKKKEGDDTASIASGDTEPYEESDIETKPEPTTSSPLLSVGTFPVRKSVSQPCASSVSKEDEARQHLVHSQ